MADCLRGIQKLWCSVCFIWMWVIISIVAGYGDEFTTSAQLVLLFAGGLPMLIFLISVAYQNSQCCEPRSLMAITLEENWDEVPLEVLSRISNINYHTQMYVYQNNGGEGNNCAGCLVQFRRGESVMKIESCSHVFHENCVYNWLHQHMTCPICQLPFDSEPVGRRNQT